MEQHIYKVMQTDPPTHATPPFDLMRLAENLHLISYRSRVPPRSRHAIPDLAFWRRVRVSHYQLRDLSRGGLIFHLSTSFWIIPITRSILKYIYSQIRGTKYPYSPRSSSHDLIYLIFSPSEMPDPPQPPHPLPSAAAVEPIQGLPEPTVEEKSSTPLERKSSRLARLALTRSTDAHPPHHAHFDMEEGGPDSGSDTPHHEPHHRTGSPARHKPVIDIEHVPVDDDPRDWSDGKKNFVMVLLTVSVVRTPSKIGIW